MGEVTKDNESERHAPIPNAIYTETQKSPNHPTNQDALVHTENTIAVLDGMTGGVVGDLASQTVAADIEGLSSILNQLVKGEIPDVAGLPVPNFPAPTEQAQAQIAAKYKETVSQIVVNAGTYQENTGHPIDVYRVVGAFADLLLGADGQLAILRDDYVATLSPDKRPENPQIVTTASIVFVVENPQTGFLCDDEGEPLPQKEGEHKYAIVVNDGNSRVAIYNKESGLRVLTTDGDTSMVDRHNIPIAFFARNAVNVIHQTQQRLANTADLSYLPEADREHLRSLGVIDVSELSREDIALGDPQSGSSTKTTLRSERSMYKHRNALAYGVGTHMDEPRAAYGGIEMISGVEVVPGDIIITMTDGISHTLTNAEIAEICQNAPDVSQIPRLLREQANHRVEQLNTHLIATGKKQNPDHVDGADDITVAVLDPFPQKPQMTDTESATNQPVVTEGTEKPEQTNVENDQVFMHVLDVFEELEHQRVLAQVGLQPALRANSKLPVFEQVVLEMEWTVRDLPESLQNGKFMEKVDALKAQQQATRAELDERRSRYGLNLDLAAEYDRLKLQEEKLNKATEVFQIGSRKEIMTRLRDQLYPTTS